MLSNERQNAILEYLQKKKSATVKELAGTLFVSDATVRRDLGDMQNLGLLKRSHGGAYLLEEADEISIFVRMTENAREKERAATNALPFIPSDFKTVYLDSSSTVLALAERLDLSGKTVVTNSLQTVVQLSKVKDIHLIVPGGTISRAGVSIAGSWTNSLLAEFRFDLMLSSCAALTPDGAFETSMEQRDVKRTVFDRSSCNILIADRSKFYTRGAYFYEPLSAFDRVIFDTLTEEERGNLKGINVFCP